MLCIVHLKLYLNKYIVGVILPTVNLVLSLCYMKLRLCYRCWRALVCWEKDP